MTLGAPGPLPRVEPASAAWLEALADGDHVFTQRFGIAVAPGWAVFPESIPYALELARSVADPRWGFHLFFDVDGVLVGNGGWKGEPVNGIAELGYAVAPGRRNRGLATAAVRILLERGRAAGVRVVVAHTLAHASASTSVLTRCGFTQVGEDVDPEEGLVWRWELRLAD